MTPLTATGPDKRYLSRVVPSSMRPDASAVKPGRTFVANPGAASVIEYEPGSTKRLNAPAESVVAESVGSVVTEAVAPMRG